MIKTLEMWLVGEGVSQPRIARIKKDIVKNKLDVPDYCKMEDGTLGNRWAEEIRSLMRDKDQLKINEESPTLTVKVGDDGKVKKQYNLPSGWTGKQFADWLELYRECVDYWVQNR